VAGKTGVGLRRPSDVAVMQANHFPIEPDTVLAKDRIYRRCMRAQGWERIQTNYPTDRQFRGPEDEDEFFSPPNPLSARGADVRGRADDPTCLGPSSAARPSHCGR
jgi:hypothetical protein